MRARTSILFLLALPSIIGILLFLGFSPDAAILLAYAWKLTKIVAAAFFTVWFLNKVFVGAASYNYPHEKRTVNYINKQRDTPLESGWSEKVDKNTRILHADGYAFEITNRFSGQMQWREVDPSSKSPLTNWTSSHPKEVAMKGQAEAIKDSITRTVNAKKGIY